MMIDAGFGGCIIVAGEVEDGAVACFSDSGGNKREAGGLLHCVTAGSRGKGRERRQEEENRGTARRERGVSSLT